MPLSQIIHETCKVCGKLAVETERMDLGFEKIIFLACGHSTSSAVIAGSDYSGLSSSDGKRLMDFQIDGVKFLESSSGRALLGDEQGLGKTVQACAFLKLHKNEALPCVVVTKSTIKVQWMWELFRWIGTKKIQVIFSSKEIALPGMDIYVTTYDMIKNENLFSGIEVKTLILDECQKVKNHLSGRAKAVQKISSQFEYILGLSGTPIMNNAGEYFTILNILQPKLFSNYEGYLREHCDSYTTMYGPKTGGLKNPDRFKELTKDFILRRRLEDVMNDIFKLKLPRKFHHVELDAKLNKEYARAQKDLEELYYSDEGNDNAAIIAIMTRMRQITGISKTFECVDFVEGFLEGTDRKIAIFAHHHLAVNLLETNLNKSLLASGLNECVMLRAGDDSKAKLDVLASSSKSRVIICSGIAAGEGMDGLQKICSDMIMLERQWNPAIEEQIESRLVRYGQDKPVNCTYFIASGTIDEYFTELVEQKRAIVSGTLDNKHVEWNSAGLLQELAEVLATTGRKRWRL